MEANRVLIFAGGTIDPVFLKNISQNDIIIGADRGALFLVEHGISPDISVGDFDSVSPEELEKIKKSSKELIQCDAVNKDLTDTELAFEVAIQRHATEIVMVGVLGSRLDHTLSNIQMMLRGMQHQITSVIWDTNNYVTLTGTTCEIEDRGYTYVSLLPLTPEVTGIHLEGFMYPLDNATLKMGQSLGVSNRLKGERGTIRIESGLLLIIQSKD
ncbi:MULTISPECIES: thiamine diphosphokinase [Paenibacillus]|uniref:Thiamine diphosphokinase n=1 Tax=Paenibacillus vini TaxID=1476024 RepID=A0ABQ4MJF1_9BACL|nr:MULTISPECIES: thiamine diphosphokinase [Paenibacillus]MBQ4898203.1 thiamine diphosphokinase [Paenibacillus sp. Marseille-P2973]GIP56115.1 thiamine pyrophosphokinase [Paenibacillus vini]